MPWKITVIMTINYHIMGTCTLGSEESCKVLSSHLTEVFVTLLHQEHALGPTLNGLSAKWLH